MVVMHVKLAAKVAAIKKYVLPRIHGFYVWVGGHVRLSPVKYIAKYTLPRTYAYGLAALHKKVCRSLKKSPSAHLSVKGATV
jgi:hypothetical protein